MSTPPESPSTDRLVREAAGLLVSAVGALLVLVALACIHPVLGTTAVSAAALAVSYSILRPRGRRGRITAWALSSAAVTTGVVTAFLYSPCLGWVELGVVAVAAGAWLASEGA
ncbi:hypothetical protein ACIQCR_17050 [Streptomyces sp. NPDC093249]|uniref:hypothetical protein n=1 Tax=unclassified Streptomyces TaxID=2593676 RepID=UPI00344EEC34